MVYIPESDLNCNSGTNIDTKNDNVISQKNRDILIIPSGCLATTVLKLSCKGIQEQKYYSFDLKNRMLTSDEIVSVEMYPNNDTVTSEKVSYDKQTFTILISGGETITDVGINFIIKTLEGETLEFNCILPIRPEGILEAGSNYNVIMGMTGPAGKTAYTIDIGTVETLEPDQNATADITHGANGEDTLNLGLVQGEQGEPGKDGINGQDGKSYINDGSQILDVKAITLSNIQSVDLKELPEDTVCLDAENSQLVIKKNNSWKVLNMSNFDVQTTYTNNNGVLPINFAADKLIASSDAKTTGEGITLGFLSLDTSKTLVTPITTLIRVDFKISPTDNTDSDYFIVGYENNLNIRINPNKKTVSVYSGTSKSYDMDYTAFGVDLHDNKFHTIYFILGYGYLGYTAYAIDGHYFNRSIAPAALYMTNLRVRGTSTITVPENALTICNVGISSTLPTLTNNQPVTTDFTSFEGFYSCKNGNFDNQSLSNGILLKPFSNYDCFNSVRPLYLDNNVINNQALFNEDGFYKGLASINADVEIPTFTFECYFKYSSIDDTDKAPRRSIIGSINNFSVGIKASSNSIFTYKDYTKNIEITLVEDIQKDVWHTLAMSCLNNVVYLFVDGVLKGSSPYFNFGWNWVYLRGLDWNAYIVNEKALYLKNISFTVGEAKYLKNYDDTLTPDYPSNSESFFYPLINGRVGNENIHSPLLQINLNEEDSFKLKTVPMGQTANSYNSLKSVNYDYNNQPPLLNTKGSNLFVKEVTGSPLKGTV